MMFRFAASKIGRRSVHSAFRFVRPTVNPASFLQESRSFSTAQPMVTDSAMFCRQCEQTKDNYACTTLGVCGKTPETSAIQDTLIQVIKTVSIWAVAAREAGIPVSPAINEWTIKAAFSTMTNVNFSEDRIATYIREGIKFQEELAKLVPNHTPTGHVAELSLHSGLTNFELEEFGQAVSVPVRQNRMGDNDCFSLNEIGTYGIKGVSAYASHVWQIRGTIGEDIMAGIHEVWAKLDSNKADMNGLLANALRVGEINGAVLNLLDAAHADTYGSPVPTEVKVSAVEGKAILISGHDMADLKALLEQTEGTGINVYTHGEMLPAHGYPELKKHSHLVGNYGTAWQNQKIEFAMFPGPVVVTTNCIIEPRRVYKKRIYTMNEVGFDGVEHIGETRDFSPVIAQAQKEKGFKTTIEPARYHTVGFNHRVVLPLANQIIDAAKSGSLSRIFLIGGCDGTQWDRNYFTELAEETPDDSIILTLGCAKNRLINSEKLMGAKLANGLPRVLDMGQCNDAYSAIVVATELAKALDCSINDLPLSLAISHLEQKAAAVLLTLLSMGVKNIRLGPSIPAYITPNVLRVLVDNYNIMPTGNAQEDLKAMMSGN